VVNKDSTRGKEQHFRGKREKGPNESLGKVRAYCGREGLNGGEHMFKQVILQNWGRKGGWGLKYWVREKSYLSSMGLKRREKMQKPWGGFK